MLIIPETCVYWLAVVWARRSARLRRLFQQLTLLESSMTIHKDRKVYEDASYKRTLETYWQQHDRLLYRIEKERNMARMNPLPMAFVTFETSRHIHIVYQAHNLLTCTCYRKDNPTEL